MELDLFYGILSIISIPFQIVQFVVWNTLDFVVFDVFNLTAPIFG